MKSMSVTEVRDQLSETINRVAYRGERVVVRRSGKEVVALIPVGDLALLEELEDRIDIEEARKALAESDKPIPYAKVRKDLGL